MTKSKISDLNKNRSARILLVEDNKVNRQVAAELLKHEGIVVIEAINGREAVDYMARPGETALDAILMDIQMPEMDGYEATREIRRSETENQEPGIPIIALTAHAMVGEREKCIKAGMNDYLSKPVDPDQFLEILTKWMWPVNREIPADFVENHKPLSPDEIIVELPETIDGIDIDAAMKRVAGNKKLLRELILSMGKNYADFPHKIQSALAEGNDGSAIHQIHTMKGIAGNIGANALFRSADLLEKALRDKSIDYVDKFADNFAIQFERILNVAASLEDREVNGANAGKMATRFPDHIVTAIELLKELTAYLITDLTEAMVRLESLEALLGHSAVKYEFGRLSEAMAMFDTEGAMHNANQIIRELENG